ncbi:DUF1642 domain-containing protein [Pediococcus pentosaceus]|uniref:DUF1642 domain-containing protein n=1 Tax=Pediococcus pentosaceus TaxID=1255 RepID=UPI001F1D5028|nr:DUF1642 domain-containing protein [Pediococcus pentosaceus]MCE5960689.1 DUF1642 domain-containing protein [Pediococcus pentosaceus]
MTKDEYVKTLQKEEDDNAQEAEDNGYGSGYYDGLDYAVDLAEKLDEPRKVVIPQFIANDIDRRKKEGSTIRNSLEDVFGWGTESCVHDWFVFVDDGDENIRKYISAWINGYEVEKEPKYLVKIKGICQGNQWLDYELVGDKRYFEINTESEKYKTYFTKQWLKDNWSEYDAYNNAGLLEFEEVEDD